MTQPTERVYTLQSAPDDVGGVKYDLDYFASNVTGGSWTLTLNDTSDEVGHQVSIHNDTATDHSLKTALVTGFFCIYPITETVSLPAGNATTKSTKYFTKVVSIVPSATIGADTMDIGICEVSSLPYILSDWRGQPIVMYTYIGGTGTIDYTIQHSPTDPYPHTNYGRESVYEGIYDSLLWFDSSDTEVINATDNTVTNFQEVPRVLRWILNSYTNNPQITINTLQKDI